MQVILPNELKQRLISGETPNLIDVRQPEENAEFNIGGLLIPVGDILAMRTEDIEHLKDEEVICYCRSGMRSMQAALMLETMGFKNVKNLAGGIMAWQAEFGND